MPHNATWANLQAASLKQTANQFQTQEAYKHLKTRAPHISRTAARQPVSTGSITWYLPETPACSCWDFISSSSRVMADMQLVQQASTCKPLQHDSAIDSLINTHGSMVFGYRRASPQILTLQLANLVSQSSLPALSKL